MVELISYWKAVCPPMVSVPIALTPEQAGFWKKLYYNGLGEFFYLNGIDADPETFMEISTDSGQEIFPAEFPTNPERVLVPVGGGKDSVVTLELLKNEFDVIPMAINPGRAILDTIGVSGVGSDKGVFIRRSIDPLLIELNARGFLNGHTPFSALLAFVSLLAAGNTGSAYIALSNESSANEPTVPGGANHQYSKSLEFERDFRAYASRWVTPNTEYFSFLRPLTELEIARLFSGMKDYHPVFRSCNRGSKEGVWCGRCPKCLFTAVILGPYIAREELKNIFGRDILDDSSLWPELQELCGIKAVKPFECVGTVSEVNLALSMIRQKYDPDLPALIRFWDESAKAVNIEPDTGFNTDRTEHFLPERFLKILKGAAGQ
ncbi:MAG: hypothetical protein Kow00127_01280 [Bacteroidales bacterium]